MNIIPVRDLLLKDWPRETNCWDFAKEVYRKYFNIEVGPDDEQKNTNWKTISFSELEVGDMVLFKESKVRRHVGIHITDFTFIHFMQGIGAVVSKYNDPTWQYNFLRAYRWKG